MSRELIVIAGPDVGKTFPLAEGQTLVIGRGQASQTQLADPKSATSSSRVLVDLIFLKFALVSLVELEPATCGVVA